MKRTILSMSAALFCAAWSALAATDQPVDLKACKTKYEQETARIEIELTKSLVASIEQYKKTLDALSTALQKAGDLDGLLAVKQEKERVELDAEMPEEVIVEKPARLRTLQLDYQKRRAAAKTARHRKIVLAASQYGTALDQLMKALTRQGKIDEAVKVKEELGLLGSDELLADAKAKLGEETKKVETVEEKKEGAAGLPAALRKGLMTYYPFDEDEGNKVADASGNGHDGTAQGAKWTPNGKVGGAYSFSGSDYVHIGYQPAGTQITLAAWVKPANTQHGFFLGTHYGETSLWMLTVEGQYGPPKQCARIGYNTGSGGEALFGKSNVQDGKWHHIAATIDSVGAKLYVDGVLERQNSVRGNWKGGNAAIGRSLTGSPGYYSGLVDEVMIFNRPLSASEIKEIYNAQK